MQRHSLLQTKLFIPPIRPELVPRPRLVERLDAGVDRKFTLISAPAGFGKTTLVSEWVDTLDCPVTWLSLEPEDDDPGRFFAYLVAALQRVDANLGQEIQGVLRSGQLPPAEVISATLINDVLQAQRVGDRFLLVLDDFHVIQDQSILQVLERLVASPPQPLHLVLLTREDPPLPLARLRANNQLTEIRARDLRFAGDDVERFLHEVLGLSLSRDDVTALEAKTEGWVVGLQLAGLSIRDRANPSAFIATLSGSHRFILSYLTEEVLNRQPEEVQRFLLQTSILDKLNGDLCNAITGRADGRVLLEQLFSANLFLIPLDDEGRWYRYHHLFADLLRDLQRVLQKDDTVRLHQRAAHWYAQAGCELTGERGAFVSEAFRHALAAEDYGLAVDLLEHHAMDMIMQGYAKTVNGWVQAIPPAWARSSPKTHLAFAWMHLLRGGYAEASPHLERLEGFFSGSQVSEEESRALNAEWLVMQSLLLNRQGRIEESLNLATQALEIASEHDSRVRSLAHFGQAGAYQVMNEYGLAVNAYRMAIQHGRAAENLITEMMSTCGLAQLAFEHGQLHLAFEIAETVGVRLEESGSLPPISAVVYGMLGEVLYHWLQIEEARRHSLRALQLSTLGGYNSGMIGCQVLLSRLSQLAGDLEDAAHRIQQAVGLMQVDTPGYVRQEAIAQQVRVDLARNRPVSAETALQGQGFSFQDRYSFPDLPPEQSISHSVGLLYNSSLHLLLYHARTKDDLTGLGTGIDLASRLFTRALQSKTLLAALEALLLRAQMHAARGSTRASQADYARALQLAEPEGILGVFVEQGPPVAEALADLVKQDQLEAAQARYAESVLAAFSRSQPPGAARDAQPSPDPSAGIGPAALIEPLTDRELDVLHLMAEGLKYKEIAERLFISLNTVRSHVKAIYGKLHVNNRTQAVKVARKQRIM